MLVMAPAAPTGTEPAIRAARATRRGSLRTERRSTVRFGRGEAMGSLNRMLRVDRGVHHGVVDLATVDALCSPQGRELMSSLPRPYNPAAAMRLTSSLRARGHSPELVAAALTQSELRTRGERKFGAASHDMLFTRDGLEQSSRPAVAELHASRFAAGGVGAVHDLGCGIGADSMAFAEAGLTVEAVESDPVTAAVAAFNLAADTGPPGGRQRGVDERVRVHHGQAQDPRWRREAEARRAAHPAGGTPVGVWLDPGRRTGGVADVSGRTRRVRAPDQMSPPWETVQALAREWPAAGVKLGAGLGAVHAPPEGAEAHWVSHDGEAVECVLWWGALAREPGTRSALVHAEGQWHRLRASGETLMPPPVSSPSQVGPVLYELDPAVAAAGLRAAVGLELQARTLGSAAYLSGDRVVRTPWARAWNVHEVLPLRTAPLRRWARREDVGALTVKRPSRRASGGDVVPDADVLRRRVAPAGSRAATLLLSDLGPASAGVALWVSPCAGRDERAPS